MHSQATQEEVRQARRVGLFAGVFIAGLIGGVAVSGTFARAPQARPVGSAVQVGAISASLETASPSGDPSLPDAGTVLRHHRSERPETVAPTF